MAGDGCRTRDDGNRVTQVVIMSRQRDAPVIVADLKL